MKISVSQTEKYDLKDFVARFYIEKKQRKDFNILLVDCNTRHYRTKIKNAIRTYFVIGGRGTFIINGLKTDARKYDLFIVSDGEIYEYEGKMKLLEINIPATDISNEEKLD